jgi:hypothetical protein
MDSSSIFGPWKNGESFTVADYDLLRGLMSASYGRTTAMDCIAIKAQGMTVRHHHQASS